MGGWKEIKDAQCIINGGGATNYGWMGVGKCGEPNFPLFCGSNKWVSTADYTLLMQTFGYFTSTSDISMKKINMTYNEIGLNLQMS